MTRNILVLTCAAAALAGGVAIAQDATTYPPLNQPDVETAAQNANEASQAASPSGPSVASEAPDQPTSESAAAPAQTPTASNSSADVSTDGAWTTQSQSAAVEPNVAPDTAVNPAASDNTSVAQTPATTTDIAQTPAPQPASATVSSMAYGANIANAPGGVFKAKVGNYAMSHYASPSRPLPYDQVEAYLKASPKQQLAQNWWSNDQLASTSTASDASATVSQTPAASDASVTTSEPAPSPALPGDTDVGLKSDTTPASAAPSPVTSNADPNTAGIGTDSSAVTAPSTNPSQSQTP